MKKFITVILCLALCLSLCGCIKIVIDKGDEEDTQASSSNDKTDNGKTDGKPDIKTEGKKDNGAEIKALWKQLNGIWLTEDADGSTYFTEFASGGGSCTLTQGMPATEYAFGGQISDFKQDGSEYSFVVEVAAVPSTDEYEGHDGYTLSYFCEPQSDGTLQLTNHAGDGSYVTWNYSSDSWEHFDWDAFYAAAAGLTLQDAWAKLAGVWTAKSADGTTWFDYFLYENGDPVFSSGIPYSGYGIGAKVTGFEDRTSDSTWWINLHFSAVPASEEQSGSPARDVLIMVDYTNIGSGKIDVTNIAGDGKVLTFTYRCVTLDKLPLD